MFDVRVTPSFIYILIHMYLFTVAMRNPTNTGKDGEEVALSPLSFTHIWSTDEMLIQKL